MDSSTPGFGAAPEDKEGKVGGDSHQGLVPAAQISRASSDGGEFNGRAACSPSAWGPAPLQRDQGQSSRETLKIRTPTRSTHLHICRTNTRTQETRHTRQRPSLLLARVLPLSPFPRHRSRPRDGERPDCV